MPGSSSALRIAANSVPLIQSAPICSNGASVPRPDRIVPRIFQHGDPRVQQRGVQAAHIGRGIDPRQAGLIPPGAPLPVRMATTCRSALGFIPCVVEAAPIRPWSCRGGAGWPCSRRKDFSAGSSTGPSTCTPVIGLGRSRTTKRMPAPRPLPRSRSPWCRHRCRSAFRRPGCRTPGCRYSRSISALGRAILARVEAVDRKPGGGSLELPIFSWSSLPPIPCSGE